MKQLVIFRTDEDIDKFTELQKKNVDDVKD